MPCQSDIKIYVYIQAPVKPAKYEKKHIVTQIQIASRKEMYVPMFWKNENGIN